MLSYQEIDFQLNFLFQTAAEGILLTDSAGLLVRLNPAAASMLRLAPGTSPGRPVSVLFKQHPALVRLFTQTGEHQGQIPLPHKRTAFGVGMDRPDGGRVVLLHDITEQADIESRREALIRAVSHDLRGPLNALEGYADLVGKFGDLAEDQARFLGRIRQTVQKLYDLSASLVDLAWIEAGMALTHQPIELAHVIRDVAEGLTDEARQRSVIIVISIQDPIPPVMGDPLRIKQMIHCLLENAVRYSLPMSNVAIHAWQDGHSVHCTVADQGIGISPADQDYIWDRLWRSSDERVRVIHGGGIGLTFVKTIVERHGGQVSVQSKLNEGATFTFVLPLAEGW